MIYLVSSLHRSGSSMAMRCLAAGGLDAAYTDCHEPLNTIYGREGYLPNPHGFYATPHQEFYRPDFVAAYDGRLVKCPRECLLGLPRHAYRLLWMRRDPDEVIASMRFMCPDGGLDWAIEIVQQWDTLGPPFFAALAARGDMDMRVLDYADVVADPVRAFAGLGWPIDECAAAARVDPALRRFTPEHA